MSTRWSSDFIVAEHKDLQASAMTIDRSGSLALLYGRRYLAVVNLDEPAETLKKVLRQSKYEVGTADWNPTPAQEQLFAFSSNQRVEVLRWSNCDLVTEHSLKAHTRVVADLHWHRTDPNLLATCSLDTFLHIWDLRDIRRPALSLSAVVGASHVRWNWTSKDVLASAHDGDVKVWDQRKGTAPFQYVSAHLAKIHSLDWNSSSDHHLVTSSQDCTVKFFDVNSPRRAESVLTFTSPVWRARHAPFGNGLVTVVVSPIRREENSLLLWNTDNQAAPVHTFVGHTDVVQEVAWRKQKEDCADFELVTWCKDQSLRIWRIEPPLQKLCGHLPIETNDEAKDIITEAEIHTEVVLETPETVVVNPSPEPAEPVAPLSVMSSPSQAPKTLQQEFSLTNFNIPNVHVDEVDAVARTCIVTVTAGSHVAVLLFSFPPGYPFNSSPTFQLIKGSTLDTTAEAKILKAVRQTAQQRVRKNKSCLEPCLRQLVTSLEAIALSEDPTGNLDYLPQQYLEPTNVYGSFKDAYIPFPRSSGAAFCSAGLLVCFGRPPTLTRRVSVRSESNSTPRSLSALGPASSAFVPVGSIPPIFTQTSGGAGSQVQEAQSMASFYFPDRQRARSKGRNSASGPSTHRGSIAKAASKVSVVIYDAAGLLFVHRELAEKYRLKGKDTAEACHYNAGVALSAGRKDLAQVWQLAALAAATPPLPLPLASHWSENDEDSPSAWAAHPFGRSMIEALIQHYASQSDVQTAAMLSCMFGSRLENHPTIRKKITNTNVSRLASGKWCLKPGGSPYHTVHPADTSLEGWNFNMLKQNRSNSWSDSLDEIKLLATSTDTTDAARLAEIELSHRMLDDKNSELHDCFKRVYAEILYRWDLLEARAQVLKYVSSNFESHRGVEFLADCLHCAKPSPEPSCSHCKRLSLQCAICHISVRGSANCCLVCGHGGHTQHMTSWFAKEEQCPTGCGCKCLKDSGSILEP